MKLKRIAAAVIAAAAVVLNAGSVFAANPIVSVSGDPDYSNAYIIEYGSKAKRTFSQPVLLFVNGDYIFDADPVIKNGTTLVPLRVISDRLGAEVYWDSATRNVQIYKGDVEIIMAIGNRNMLINGEYAGLNYPPEIINNLTYVPLRAIADAFGSDVGFAGGISQSAKIVYVQDTDRTPVLGEAEAVKMAENLYFNGFLPTMRDYIKSNDGIDVSGVTAQNYNQKFRSKRYVGKCTADLGEYYYIQLFENQPYGVLVDKYDAACYSVGAASMVCFEIGYGSDYVSWGWMYQ